MSITTLLLFVAGAALLILGHKKNNRAWLTVAAFFWLASGNWSEFATGFSNGMQSVVTPTASSSVK
ncbi:hypothetical protein SAMN05216319_0452 [Duganella sp. CF402]|uniref:hypothetical protein n=1 Tax=unclassified Duganella TaxID=2636909 RepID=UPI0008D614E1|nr:MULTISPECIES: hypothetical protein [unclassified Duganella]RZT11074.1 hypothetical protein EV582_3174 [Duganella sp. BK701]SEK82696.1 hypothetical protein SAMN05216319_0452 [Duganella sp. CF402]